jgi:hypothetical protein
MHQKHYKFPIKALVLAVLSLGALDASASSHREAPLIAGSPRVDGTDFYMFNSYGTEPAGDVTLIANYNPLQDPFGGPNYFSLDPNASYDINIDNNGDGIADLVFSVKVTNTYKNITLPVGGKDVAIPLLAAGQIGKMGDPTDTAALNLIQTYTVALKRGQGSKGTSFFSKFSKANQATTVAYLTDASTGSSTFTKPIDNIGNKTLPDYAAYANNHIYSVKIPGCAGEGKLFVGQRKDGFVVALGETFDLVNLNPLGNENVPGSNSLANKNVTSIAIEVPASCLATSSDPVIGAWTTASLPSTRVLTQAPKSGQAVESNVGNMVQVSRLGMPLVNEVVIGLPDKDRFNASQPKDDAQFLTYVTNPTLPVLLNVLYGVTPPTTPRNDLVQVFLTGVPGLNQPKNVKPAEMLRLNTSIPAVDAAAQDHYGVLGGDVAGFPNGRRPGDDVVDISLRAAMGVLLPLADAPSGQLAYTDGAHVDATMFDNSFPYLTTPLPGAVTAP